MRTIVFSERLAPPFDEGIKNIAFNTIAELSRQHEVMGLTNFGASVPEHGIRRITSNRLLVSAETRRAIARFAPDLIVYVPTASATVSSFFRSRLLGWYGKGCPVAMWSTQPRKRSGMDEKVIRHLRPTAVFAQSPTEVDDLARLGCRSYFLPSGINLDRFSAIPAHRRPELRQKHGLDPGRRVILHIGHIKTTRNVQVFAQIQQAADIQVVLVGSTAPHLPQDAGMIRRLQECGVRVVSDYVPAIEELYQLADCYVFPVQSEEGCVGVPLSVLEAMACNLPVVSTRFGALPRMFVEGRGFFFVDGEAEIADRVRDTITVEPATREMVTPYSWKRICESMVTKTLEAA